MHRSAALALGLVVAACSPNKGQGGNSAESASSEAKAPAQAEAPDQTQAPGKTSAEDEPIVDLECGSLLTSVEVAQACGIDSAPMKIQGMEGVDPKATCARSFDLGDGKLFNFILAVHEDAAAASALPWPERHESLAIGDAAGTYIKNQADQFDWHTVEVRRGRYVMYLRGIVNAGVESPCSPDGVESMATQLVARL